MLSLAAMPSDATAHCRVNSRASIPCHSCRPMRSAQCLSPRRCCPWYIHQHSITSLPCFSTTRVISFVRLTWCTVCVAVCAFLFAISFPSTSVLCASPLMCAAAASGAQGLHRHPRPRHHGSAAVLCAADSDEIAASERVAAGRIQFWPV